MTPSDAGGGLMKPATVRSKQVAKNQTHRRKDTGKAILPRRSDNHPFLRRPTKRCPSVSRNASRPVVVRRRCFHDLHAMAHTPLNDETSAKGNKVYTLSGWSA